MDKFFREVESAARNSEALKDATSKIRKLNDDMLLTISGREEKKYSKDLRRIVDTSNKRAKKTKETLQVLQKETETLETEQKLKENDLRVRKNLVAGLTRKFVDEMKLYQAAQQKYKMDLKTKATRQIKIIKPDATEDEVESILTSNPDGGRDALIQQQVLRPNDQIQTAYRKAHEKYQDVLVLERSIAELHKMFLDFALLTEQQGEILDQIEFHVQSAGDHVDEANEDVVEAIEIQKKIRKKQLMTILIGAAIFVILVIVLLP